MYSLKSMILFEDGGTAYRLEVRLILKLYKKHFSRVVILPYSSSSVRYITNWHFLRWRTVAILDLDVMMIQKPHKNHFSGWVMPTLVENDT